jgi:hypothetical protein
MYIEGLSLEILNQRPAKGCNSIGWLTWHIAREIDYNIAELSGGSQVWVKDCWYEVFNLSSDPMNTGFLKQGHSVEDADSFISPNVVVLLQYLKGTIEAAKSYIKSLDSEELDRKLDYAWSWERCKQSEYLSNHEWAQFTPSTGTRLISILAECLQHAGQVAYIRGLIQGRGWLPV